MAANPSSVSDSAVVYNKVNFVQRVAAQKEFSDEICRLIRNAGIFADPSVALFGTIVNAEILPDKTVTGIHCSRHDKFISIYGQKPGLKLKPNPTNNEKRNTTRLYVEYSYVDDRVTIKLNIPSSESASYHSDYETTCKLEDMEFIFMKFIYKILDIEFKYDTGITRKA